jgi:hypothetical protein
MSDLHISRVPSEFVDEIWERVEPFLKRGVDASRGRFDMPSLYKDIKAGNQQLWVIFKDDDNLVCSLTTQFMYYPLRVNMSVPFIGSDDTSFSNSDWVDMMLVLMDFAKINGCSAVESVGRRAWARIFKDIGFEETFTTVEGEI